MASRGFDQRDAPQIFGLADFARKGVANFFEAGKIPEVRKLATLLRLHRLHGAVFAFEKNARAVGLFLKRKTAPIRAQLGVALNKIGFAQALERREPRNFGVVQQHLPRPATTGRAALTFEENRHASNDNAIRISGNRFLRWDFNFIWKGRRKI